MITHKIEFSYFEGDEKKSEFVIIREDNKENAIKKACSLFEISNGNIKHYDIENIESADFG